MRVEVTDGLIGACYKWALGEEARDGVKWHFYKLAVGEEKIAGYIGIR